MLQSFKIYFMQLQRFKYSTWPVLAKCTKGKGPILGETENVNILTLKDWWAPIRAQS